MEENVDCYKSEASTNMCTDQRTDYVYTHTTHW